MDVAFILDIIGRLGRTFLQVIGTYLVTKGMLTEVDWTTVSGAIVAIVTTVYTIYSAKKASNDAAAATSAAAQKAVGV